MHLCASLRIKKKKSHVEPKHRDDKYRDMIIFLQIAPPWHVWLVKLLISADLSERTKREESVKAALIINTEKRFIFECWKTLVGEEVRE